MILFVTILLIFESNAVCIIHCIPFVWHCCSLVYGIWLVFARNRLLLLLLSPENPLRLFSNRVCTLARLPCTLHDRRNVSNAFSLDKFCGYVIWGQVHSRISEYFENYEPAIHELFVMNSLHQFLDVF